MSWRQAFSLIIFACYLAPGLAWAGTAKDARGVEITTKEPPQRIISNALSSDEIILGLLAGAKARERIIAVSPKAVDPRFTNIFDQLGNRLKTAVISSPEQIIAAKPDLVILSVFNRPEFVRAVEKTKTPVFVIKAADSLKDIEQSIVDLGHLLHAEAAATNLVQNLQTQIADVAQKASQVQKHWNGRKPRLVYFDPDNIAIGDETIFNNIVNLVGAENVAATGGLKGWPKLSTEMLVSWKPEVIIAAGETKDLPTIMTALQKTRGWKDLEALKKRRVVLLSERELYATSQYVVQAAQNLQKQLLELKP